jgi:hypothetical protein
VVPFIGVSIREQKAFSQRAGVDKRWALNSFESNKVGV